MKICTQMNHEFIPRFPRVWERFLDHSRPEQALSLESVASFPILSASVFVFFLRLWSRRFAFFPHTLANLELDFFTVLVPWPIMIWNLKYIHLPFGKQICTFPVSQFMVKAWVDWMPGITSSRSWEGFCVGRLFSKTIDLLKILTPSRSRIFSVLKRVIFSSDLISLL